MSKESKVTMSLNEIKAFNPCKEGYKNYCLLYK